MRKIAIISPFRTDKNVQHTTHHTLHELIHTTYKTKQTSQNMMLNKLTKTPLKRGHDKQNTQFPPSEPTKTHNIQHTTHYMN